MAQPQFTPSMRMLRLEGAGIPKQLERSLDTRSFDAPVDMITSFSEGDDVKIIVAANTGGGHDPVLEEKPGQLVWRFPRAKRGERSEVVSMGSKVGGFVKPPTTSARSSGKRGKWRGERIDIEFYADNPGQWFFHCHNLYHLAAGMARKFEYIV